MSSNAYSPSENTLPGNLPLRVKDVKILLQEPEHRFRNLANAAPVGIFLNDPEGNAIFINKKCAELIGAPPHAALKFDWLPYLHPDDRDSMASAWQRAVATKSEFHLEYRWLHKDGKVVWTLGDVVPIKDRSGNVNLFIGTLTDITSRKQAELEKEKLQEQLMQVHKMESIGRLAGSVAHDYRNIMQIITGYAEQAMDDLETQHPVHAMLSEIHNAAERSAKITRQLLAFARKQKISPTVFDINKSIENIRSMLNQLLGQGIEIIWEPYDAEICIEMDPVQLDQILINLCINARDAMQGNGKIVINVSRTTIDQKYCQKDIEAHLGEFAVLSVSDNGTGMNDATLQNIFEPFFTTKHHDQDTGTGLGLSIVYGTVKQYDGFIKVNSTPDKGTEFQVYLPVHKTEHKG